MTTLSPGVRRAVKASAAVGLPLGSLLVGVGGASPASASTCGDKHTMDFAGNHYHWDVGCPGSGIEVTGWVTDGQADGNCARVRGDFHANGKWKYSKRACPQGETQYFDLVGPGRTADIYGYEEP